MNGTTTLGLLVSLVTGLGIVLATYFTGRKDKDSLVRVVFEQRLAVKDDIIELRDQQIKEKDEEIFELKAVVTWYTDKLKEKDRVIHGLFKHELKALEQAKELSAILREDEGDDFAG